MSELGGEQSAAIRNELIAMIANARTNQAQSRTKHFAIAAILVAVGVGVGIGATTVAYGSNPQPKPIAHSPSYYISRIESLERAQVPADTVPVDIPGYAVGSLDPSSTRRIAYKDGVQYFLGLGAQESICILIIPRDASKWTVGCASGLPIETTNPSVGVVSVTVPGDGSRPKGIRLDANVYLDSF